MGVQFFWFYDIVALSIIISLFCVGWKKGFIKTLIAVASFAVSFAVSTFISTAVTPVIYDSFAKPLVVTVVSNQLDSMDLVSRMQQSVAQTGITITEEGLREVLASKPKNLTEAITQYMFNESVRAGESTFPKETFESALKKSLPKVGDIDLFAALPSYISGSLAKDSTPANDFVPDIIAALAESNDSAASYMEENLLRPNVLKALKPVIFLIIFAVMSGLFRGISRLFRGINRVPLVGPINRLLGGALGFLEGVVVLFLIGTVISILITFTSDSLIMINQSTVDQTLVFKYFCNYSL